MPRGEEPMKQPVVVQRYTSRAEAEAARSALAANRIESYVVSDDGGAQYPGLGFVRGVDVVVESEQLEQAQDVLTPRRSTNRSA
jgi:hypothetical protein